MQVLGLRSRSLINFDVGYKDVGYGECGAVLGQLATCDFLPPAQFEADGFVFQGRGADAVFARRATPRANGWSLTAQADSGRAQDAQALLRLCLGMPTLGSGMLTIAQVKAAAAHVQRLKWIILCASSGGVTRLMEAK
jgi:hypothetical protein